MANPNDGMKKMNDINSVVTDAQLEAGEFPIGRIIHVSTVTHAVRGKLKAVTPSHYIFEKGTCHMIHDMGEIGAFSKSPAEKAREMETVHCEVRIPRLAVVWELMLS